jgi:transcriptional regulator NrdR family protein
MACFACDSEATRRCTIHLDDGDVIENKRLCEKCASEFELVEWLDVRPVADESP